MAVTRAARATLSIVATWCLVAAAVALGAAPARAQAVAPDATPSPAGPVRGVLVIVSPTGPGPALPGILLAAPTSVGSLVVPVQLPAVAGAGPAFTQLQLVIPGPNPAQNTPLALAQLLDMVLRSAQPPGPAGTVLPGPLVSVFAAPAH